MAAAAAAAPAQLSGDVHNVILNTGKPMPRLGLGTWKAEKGVVRNAVEEAIKAGYRAIDCACDYGNEKEVGEGIKAAIDAGVCKREELFITSKLWNTFHAREHVQPAIERTLADLGLDYLDLYLIHFPISLKYVPFDVRYPPEWIHDPKGPNPRAEMSDAPIRDTWEAMEELVTKGLTRHIGVSNFNVQLVMDLLRTCRIRPAVNQVELHPYLVQEKLLTYLAHVGITVTAYSPLGARSYVQLKMADETESLLEEKILKDLATKYKKSPAQVALRWHYQRGYTVIPKSSDPARLKENFDIFNFELSDAEMKQISGLDRNRRFNDPGVYGAFMNAIFPIFN